ncbi:putative glycerophosphodiester phosphodiesterase [Lupinus albus]|uniref:glycerophosphodiester phosphodiesterase n=1 Tax=Lupinus albus TaxID=3870 RepID=A0A6A4PUP1_LUPAL|nr:putative glycerophosphodiester phosphodiesterase [Lupinus albus]
MALKVVQVSDIHSLSLHSTRFSNGVELKVPKFVVIGHRGHGMNALQSIDRRMRAIKENSIMSFNAAANFPIDFIEFDVQGVVFEKRITELCLSEFIAYGPQRVGGKDGKVLVRKTKDGKIVQWEVEQDDPLCTLEEAFLNVEPSLGFNIELKFDDHNVYDQDHLAHVLKAILKVKF